jgi:hypothetical protein
MADGTKIVVDPASKLFLVLCCSSLLALLFSRERIRGRVHLNSVLTLALSLANSDAEKKRP